MSQLTRDAEQADAELLQVLELNEQCGPAAEWLGVHRAFRGHWDEAVHYADQAFTLAGRHTRSPAYSRAACIVPGIRTEPTA